MRQATLSNAQACQTRPPVQPLPKDHSGAYRMRLLTACLLCTLALPAAAQIYKYTDSNGNTVFTNQPPEGQPTESVDLPPTNTVESQKPVATPATPEEGTEQNQQAYSRLEITGVPTEEALRANNGTFIVGVAMEPKLQPGHMLRLVMDGRPYGEPANVTSLQVTNADRGEHTLAVEVLAAGQPVQRSGSISFTVQRISVNSPARAKPMPR